jgi:two-component sensor histidine kinase
VADNGVGLPTSIGQQTYEKFGFKLVQLLTQQLEGTVAICSQSSTEITIVFTES